MMAFDRKWPQPKAAVWVLVLLAAMCAGVLWLYATAARTQVPQAVNVAPASRWLTLPHDTVLERIAVGSCLDQARPQPIWGDVIATRPQLMLMAGDNVYGDSRGDDVVPLIEAYRRQGANPDLARARDAFAFLATWDDHDYGLNDAGGDYKHRIASARLFHSFWQLKPERAEEGGIHYARIYGPPGRRVQIILLDTRSFRSPLKRKSAAFTFWGPYEPDESAQKTMLGAAQWRWLETELAKPADIRLLVSGIQVLAEGHGWERWGNFPRERERLLALLANSKAGGTIILSGDRHHGSLYRATAGAGVLYELTTSSLNRPPPGPSQDAHLPPLVSATFQRENFGTIDIGWQQREIVLRLRGIGAQSFVERRIAFAEIGAGAGSAGAR